LCVLSGTGRLVVHLIHRWFQRRGCGWWIVGSTYRLHLHQRWLPTYACKRRYFSPTVLVQNACIGHELSTVLSTGRLMAFSLGGDPKKGLDSAAMGVWAWWDMERQGKRDKCRPLPEAVLQPSSTYHNTSAIEWWPLRGPHSGTAGHQGLSSSAICDVRYLCKGGISTLIIF
jgi:hypothetical protein